jgi:starch-binding outer membrane protein, SusD/RagB family
MKKIFIILASLGLICQSCDEKLDLVNPNAPTTGEFYKTDADAKSAANSIYNILYYDGLYHRWGVLGENFRSDEIYASGPWDQMYTIGNFTQTNTWENVEDPYRHNYYGISRANQVIEALTDNVSISAGARDEALGQAYFLRGLFYFNLLKFYKNIPLVTSVPKSSAEYVKPLAAPAEVWGQIESDLKTASELLPVSWPASEAGRATKGAAIAFLGKSYLWQKKYNEAKTEFEKIMAGPYQYDLMPEYGDNFNESAPANNAESIFEVQWNSKVGGSNVGAQDWQPTVSALLSAEWPRIMAAVGFGWGDGKARPWLLAEFQKEKTVTDEVDPRLDLTLWYNKPGATYFGVPWNEALNEGDRANVFVKKYQLWRTKSGRNATADAKNAMPYYVMRFADVLLMYAEALNELGQTNAAYAPIQRVRDRVDLPDLAGTKPNMSKEAMREQIAHERTLELAGEGIRFDDINRWGWLQDPAKLEELKANDPEFKTYLPGRENYPQPQTMINVAKYPQNSGW